MATYKTPDVYVEEISIFPPSVAEVETAIPAFIGYTEKAIRKTVDDLILEPTKIYSLKEFETYFGLPEEDTIAISVADDAATGGLALEGFTEPDVKYLMYFSVKIFFENGGGQCYIVSVGTYQAVPAIDLNGDNGTAKPTMYGLKDGLDKISLFDEPTMIVIPEAVKLATSAEYQTLVQAVLLQCNTLGDRFGIFDIYEGGVSLDSTALSTNRGYFGNNFLKYGGAYYPFIKTSMNFHLKSDESNVSVTYGGSTADRKSVV